MESLKNPIVLKLWEKERGKVGKLSQNGHFQSFFFCKIWLKTPSHKSVAIETWRDLDHQIYQFLPLKDSPNGLQKLKVVESTVFEIMGEGSAQLPPPLFVEGVGSKYLRTGRIKDSWKSQKLGIIDQEGLEWQL